MIDCNECIHINVTEKEQKRFDVNHYCLKLTKRVKHNQSHPALPCICKGKYFKAKSLRTIVKDSHEKAQ